MLSRAQNIRVGRVDNLEIFCLICLLKRQGQCLHKPPKTGSHMTSRVHHLEVMLNHKLGFFKNFDLNIVFLFNDMRKYHFYININT